MDVQKDADVKKEDHAGTRFVAVREVVDTTVNVGALAIKELTGLTIGLPSDIHIFYDLTSVKGIFDEYEPSRISINGRRATNNDPAAILNVLYRYFRANRMFAEELASKAPPAVLQYDLDPYLFLEISAADFFAHVVSKEVVHPGDNDKHTRLYDLLDWSVSEVRTLRDIYNKFVNAPEIRQTDGALLRGASESLDTYIYDYIIGEQNHFETTRPYGSYAENQMYLLGKEIFALMYLAYDFDEARVVREHFMSTNSDMLAHLVETIKDDAHKNQISQELVDFEEIVKDRTSIRYGVRYET